LGKIGIVFFSKCIRMKKLSTLVFLLFCFIGVQAQFFDSQSSPRLWLRADRSVLSATGWTDVSTNNLNATGLSGECPTSGALINFNKAVFFDGVNDYLKVPVNLEGLSQLTVLSVFQSSDTTERGVWGTESFLSRNIMLTTRHATGPDTITDNYGRNEHQAILNTIAQSWESTTNRSANAYLALGGAGKTRGYKPFKGGVAELMVFTRSLGFLERLQIETYLALKYGASMNGRNYISSNKKVLWRANENAVYAHRVAGIGRDDAFQLYQKQAQSAYDSAFLTISVGTLAASNDENKSIINDSDFLLWGDNNASRATKPGEGKDSVLSIMQRKWLLTASGNTSNQLVTELQVDVSKLPNTALGHWLVVDRSGQGDFSVDNLEYILPDRITADGKAIYRTQWDTDRSGKDSFSFARARNLFAVVHKLNDPLCTNVTAGRVRIDMIAGAAPYNYTLTGTDNKISHEGKITGTFMEQKELVKGAYTLTVQDGGGDKFTRKFNMVMPDALYINLGEDQKLARSGEIVLDVKPQVPDTIIASYEWESNFGFSSIASKVTITESGIYKVTVTKQADGCAFSDEVVISGDGEQKFVVFPTVVNREELYNVSVSLPEAGSVSVHVYDLKGTVHQAWKGENSAGYYFKATLSNPGMYLVFLRTPHGTESRKVIVN
jgi:hypothetical protein